MINTVDEPLVSVICPVYNSDNVLNETISSVVDQIYTNWKLILIDDLSTDSSSEIIKNWVAKDSRITPVYLSENVGAGGARNAGLKVADGDYIAFLDSDDIWLPDKLKLQIEKISTNPEIKFLYTWYITIDQDGDRKSMFVTPEKVSFNKLKFNNYILTSTVIYKRKELPEINFSRIRRRQDWAFFLDILKFIPYAHALPKVTVLYRKMPNTLSSSRFKLIKPNFNLFRSYLYNGNIIFALVHFLVFLPFYFHNKIFNKQRIEN